jgi:hypothetical protein
LHASTGSSGVGTAAVVEAATDAILAAGGFFAAFFGAGFFGAGAAGATLLVGRFTRLAGTAGTTAAGSARPTGGAGMTCFPSRFRFLVAAAARGTTTTTGSVVASAMALDPDAVAAVGPRAPLPGSVGEAAASMAWWSRRLRWPEMGGATESGAAGGAEAGKEGAETSFAPRGEMDGGPPRTASPTRELGGRAARVGAARNFFLEMGVQCEI